MSIFIKHYQRTAKARAWLSEMIAEELEKLNYKHP
jgi:hypothetical protein